jgi:hypothetical protein
MCCVSLCNHGDGTRPHQSQNEAESQISYHNTSSQLHTLITKTESRGLGWYATTVYGHHFGIFLAQRTHVSTTQVLNRHSGILAKI